MSPLWRDEVTIVLSPRRLALARRVRGIRPRVVAATEVELPDASGEETGPAVARLADVLADPTWHGAAARVVVADHPWVRHAIVPWPGTKVDDAGRLTHARYVLADAHGRAVADWELTLADAAPGLPRLASAIPPALRGDLEQVLAPARLALTTLQPRIVAAFEAWRHRIPADDAWFVTVDDGSLAAARLSGGAWDRVHVTRRAPDWLLELERLQAFDRATRTTGPGGRMLVDAPPWERPAGAALPGIEWLDDGADGPPRGLPVLRRIRP